MISPHGGVLKNQSLGTPALETWQDALPTMPSWYLTQRQLCDIELILNGGFSPLSGFMTHLDYKRVLTEMRLASDVLWPMPITLDVTKEFGAEAVLGEPIALRDHEGTLIGIMRVDDNWQPDKVEEAQAVFGTTDEAHPGVRYLMRQAGPVYLGGPVFGIALPKHYNSLEFRKTPKQLRELFETFGWQRIVGFQTRNPMHRAHQALTMQAAEQYEANLLIHPVVGLTKPGDVDCYTRIRCYKKLLAYYPEQTTLLSFLPLAMRMGGPREALWHAIIRKNYGCTHFIVGRDHASPGKDRQGQPFYDAYEAQQLIQQYQAELSIQMIPFQEMVYVKERAHYIPINQVNDNETTLSVSGTEFRHYLQEGLAVPDWFTYPEIIAELRKTYPPKAERGFTVFFTGLSAAGKSTIANALKATLMELGGRPITLLDGDIVRKNLSSELGFSRKDRDINIRRIGFVATEITKHRGIAICAPIAPYAATRQAIREEISAYGGFIEVYVSTSIEVCEQRDPKGLYAKARSGVLKGFTGIDDPYEAPTHPEVVIDAAELSPTEAVQKILLQLEEMHYLIAATDERQVEQNSCAISLL